MLEWLLLAVSLCALAAGVFALMRANRVDAAMRRALSQQRPALGGALGEAPGALTRVAVVRFDAFTDISGKLSSSAALLDDQGNGVVITTMNGRDSTRNYLKQVSGGEGDVALSPEESDAVARAMASSGRAG